MNALSKSRKERLAEYLGGRCCKCGYDKCLNALQFHRLTNSPFRIASSLSKVSYERLLSEVKNCILLCSNCRYELEAGQFLLQYFDMREDPENREIRFICEADTIIRKQVPTKPVTSNGVTTIDV